MTFDALLLDLEARLRQVFADDSSGHDLWHLLRVRRLALRLAEREGADPQVVALAALLHDLDDWKLDPAGDGSPRKAAAWMAEAGVDADLAARVCEIIRRVSFRGAGVPDDMPTLEGQVVQDADRLDAMGAVGIARAFAYGGSRGRPLHDPAQPPGFHASFAAYRQGRGSTLNHFHEKLLHLKGRLHTAAARELAEGRHAYLEGFLARFLSEWEGDA